VSAVAIDFTLSDSQQELQKNAEAFAEGVLRPVAGLIDRADDGWESFLAGPEAYREMAHAGFTKSFIPADYVVTGAFSWTAALIGAACVGTMRAAFEYALDFARSEKRLGTVPVIEHQNVGFMLADIKMRIEACRYLTWKACHDFERTGGRAEELAIMTKVYCSEAAVATVYDCMRVIGIASYTKDLAPLERIMRDAMVFPLYDGGNQGVRRRQLHDILRHPGYDSMLAARGEPLPEDQ
jgi:alkylation response protein AidB-like acyl-CoA dehydrogenase